MIKTIFIFILLAFVPTSLTKACTAVYVGKKASADGTTIIARSEDLSSYAAYNKMFMVVPRVENKPGRIFRDSNGFFYKLPNTTYKYTTLSNGGSSSPHTFPSVCTNEKGLTITAAVDAYIKKEAVKADPYVSSGIRENSIAEAISTSCATAKEGVLKLGELANSKGVTEAYIILLADQKEAWMMEFYTGHQWAAIKLPEDKAVVMGNQFMFDTLSDFSKKDIIHSPNLFSLAEKRGFSEKEKGKIHLGKTYGKKFFTYNNGRTWMGQKLLAPNTTDKKYNPSKLYPFLFSPDKKVEVKQIMDLYRNRYEGTNLDPILSQNKDVRVIGTTKQQEVHIVQIDDKMPEVISAVQWLCLANSEHSVFVPSFSNINNTIYPYRVNSLSYNSKSAYWRFQKTAAKGNKFRNEALSKNIKAAYNNLELSYINATKKSKSTCLKLYRKSPTRSFYYLQAQSDTWAHRALSLAEVLDK